MLYDNRKTKEREAIEITRIAEAEAQDEEERSEECARLQRILYDAWKAFHVAGMGVPHLSTAIRSDELDYDLALAAIRLSRKDTIKWADYSTPDCAKHWMDVVDIFDKAEERIKREGA